MVQSRRMMSNFCGLCTYLSRANLARFSQRVRPPKYFKNGLHAKMPWMLHRKSVMNCAHSWEQLCNNICLFLHYSHPHIVFPLWFITASRCLNNQLFIKIQRGPYASKEWNQKSAWLGTVKHWWLYYSVIFNLVWFIHPLLPGSIGLICVTDVYLCVACQPGKYSLVRGASSCVACQKGLSKCVYYFMDVQGWHWMFV